MLSKLTGKLPDNDWTDPLNTITLLLLLKLPLFIRLILITSLPPEHKTLVPAETIMFWQYKSLEPQSVKERRIVRLAFPLMSFL
jgi:hypothetical protein